MLTMIPKKTKDSVNNSPGIIAIIPARGGSRGIPKKNIIPIAGKPLISYVIEAARSSKYISKIVVTTDDHEIAVVAKNCNAEVIMRPADISKDDSPSELALIHAMEQIEKTEKVKPGILVFLQCTCPLTSEEDIDNTISRLLDCNADTAFTVTPSHYFLWTENSNGEAVAVNHDKRFRKRRQDCEPQYIETGSAYVMRWEGFLENKNRFFGKTVLSIIPQERVLDIDEPADISRAESAIRLQKKSKAHNCIPEKIDAVIFDFDGVFTDNHVIVHDDGRESVLCNRSDGLGLSALKDAGIPLLVLSKEKNPVVEMRCRKIGIPCIQGIDNKKGFLKTWLKKNAFNPQNIVYLGNDINDIECLDYVGCGVVVADAYDEAQKAAKFVLQHNGGHGAIRELCDIILSVRK
jgi:YrbI family 3-deoxy-D-manno-octulosonate 8-phosphate phosphatase